MIHLPESDYAHANKIVLSVIVFIRFLGLNLSRDALQEWNTELLPPSVLFGQQVQQYTHVNEER